MRYLSFLKDLVSSYNDEKRVFGYSPRQICESDRIAKLVKVARLDSLLKFYKKHDKPPKFHLHQPVRRLLKKKNIFQKNWLPRYSPEVLRVRAIVPSVPVKYLLSGYENEPHLYNETYYESQLQAVGPETAKDYYSQEKRDKEIEKEREKEDTRDKIEELEEDRILEDRQKEDEREEKEIEKEEEERVEREKRETETETEMGTDRRTNGVETEARVDAEPRKKREEEEEEKMKEEEEELGSGSAFKLIKTKLVEDQNSLARTRSGKLRSMAAKFLIQPLGRPESEARWISEDSYNRLRKIGAMSDHHGK